MASKLASTCGPCSYRKTESNASMWCLDCREGLCNDCKDSHSSWKVLRSHTLIPYGDVDKLPEIAQNIRETCFEHNRQLEVYCSDHQRGCCIKCSTSDHKNCMHKSPMEEITKTVKSSVALINIQDKLNSLISKLEMIIEKKIQSVRDINDQTNTIKTDVQATQGNIEKKLKSVVEKVIIEADGVSRDYEAKTSDVIKTLKNNLEAARILQVSVEQITKNGSNMQLFLCLKDWESLVSSEEDRLSTDIERGELLNTELHFKYDDDFKKLASATFIGSLTTEKKPLKISTGSFEQCAMAANSKQPKPRNINKIKLAKKKELFLPRDWPFVTNCIVLPNDCMLFADFSKNKRLILFDANGNSLRNIVMESKPFDVTIVTDDVIAITLTEAEKVVFMKLTLNEDKIVKEMKTVGECYGIDYCEHRLAVAVKERGIQIFTDDGTQLRIIPFACTVLAFIQSNIAYIEVGDTALRCCNMTGKHMWQWKVPKNKVRAYPSITVDRKGCVYVTECQKVYIVSNDGSSWTQLRQSEGMSYLNGIYFNERRQELLLVTKRREDAVLYSVTEDL